MSDLEEKIKRLQGPILVLGASGFIGANLLRLLLEHRKDAVGTYYHVPAWRLEGLPTENLRQTDLLVDANLDALLAEVRPQTVLNCVAYGAYSFETDGALIHRTNFNLTEKLLSRLSSQGVAAYVHAGSSSEYGTNAAGPLERDLPEPNSDYAVSKVASANLLHFYGRHKKLPCANLRLYAIYGPLEDSSRLIPNLVKCGLEGKYPDLVNPKVSRDFVYVEDCCGAFLDAALNLKPDHYGDSFNIGSGQKTTLEAAAKAAGKVFKIAEPPRFGSMPDRKWDVKDWHSNPAKAKKLLGWEARTPFEKGLELTAEWYRGLADREEYRKSSKQFLLDQKFSVSAVVACWQDAKALPVLHQRLKRVFETLGIDHEIIFVDDASTDGSEKVITDLSAKDRKVVGISHSRRFGSQAALRSGLEVSVKNACVLMEGNLQDPPEAIQAFVEKWREGYDVVYGKPQKGLAPFGDLPRRIFYRIFNSFSYLPIPPGAGDFSLIDRKVVRAVLGFPERDFFFRGVRAFVGFRQTGVEYVPEKPAFGRASRTFFMGVDWAKKGILSFSYTPLSIISFMGTALFFVTVVLAAVQVFLRIMYPHLTPEGLTTMLLAILFFGSLNLFAVAILGEYIGKIFEEVKQRPRFVRRSVIRGGEVRSVIGNP